MPASKGFDPIGPGTPAWEECDIAINSALNGDIERHANAINRMLVLLREAGAGEDTINEWLSHIAKRTVNPKPEDDTDSDIIVVDLGAMTPSSLVILRAAFMEACNTTTSNDVADTFTRLETRVGNKLCDMWPVEMIRRTYNFAFHKRFRRTQ